MTIWIDHPIWPRHGTVFAHLVSDTSLEELHAFAERAGLHPRSFHGDHYDVPQQRYAAVLAAGATATTGADLVRRLIASGLRIRKRRGDRPVARVRDVATPDGTVMDVDLIASDVVFDRGLVVAAMVLIRDGRGRYAVVHTPGRESWGPPGGGVEPGEGVADAAVREVLEETGIVLEVADLTPAGYERFDVRPGAEGTSGRWGEGRSYLQLFSADLLGVGPDLVASTDDVDGWRWLAREGFATLSGHEFWWPLVAHLADLVDLAD